MGIVFIWGNSESKEESMNRYEKPQTIHPGSVIESGRLRMVVYTSLFAALIAAGSYMAIPAGPVPIVLQNMFVFIAGLTLGKRYGLYSVALFLFAGALGFPVFSMGKGGIGHFAGITGGYLVGYIPAVFVVGLFSEVFNRRMLFDVAGMILGTIVIYAFGVGWMTVYFGKGFSVAPAVGAVPFLLGDALKIAAAAIIAKKMRPIITIQKSFDADEHS